MAKSFDLTSKEGLERARVFASIAGGLIAPASYVAAKAAINAASKLFSSTEDTLKEQRETAVAVINAGKEAGAASIEITLDQQVGLSFGASIDGVPVKAVAGKSGNMTLKVTYK